MIGQKRRCNRVAFEQASSHPAILASDRLDGRKRFERPQRYIAQISDRRCHQIKTRRRRLRRNVLSEDAEKPRLLGCSRKGSSDLHIDGLKDDDRFVIAWVVTTGFSAMHRRNADWQ